MVLRYVRIARTRNAKLDIPNWLSVAGDMPGGGTGYRQLVEEKGGGIPYFGLLDRSV